MRMDQGRDLGRNRLPRDRQHHLRNEVGDVWSDHVDPEHRTAVPGGNDLDQPALAQDVRLADPLEVEPLDLDVVAALDGLRLGDADRGDLGGAVGDPRDLCVVDLGDREARDPFGDGVPLGERDVRELERGRPR